MRQTNLQDRWVSLYVEYIKNTIKNLNNADWKWKCFRGMESYIGVRVTDCAVTQIHKTNWYHSIPNI